MTIRLLTKVGYAGCVFPPLSECSNSGINLDKDTMKAVYDKFGLEPGTQDFIGHAMALYLDDESVVAQ